jgi:hypothetical protein
MLLSPDMTNHGAVDTLPMKRSGFVPLNVAIAAEKVSRKEGRGLSPVQLVCQSVVSASNAPEFSGRQAEDGSGAHKEGGAKSTKLTIKSTAVLQPSALDEANHRALDEAIEVVRTRPAGPPAPAAE